MRAILRPFWENRYLRLAAFLLAVAAALWFFYRTRVPWTIFLLSYTVAYLVNPLVSWLQRYRIPRWLGVFAAFLLLGGVVALTTFVVSEFVQQVTAFFERTPDLAGQIARWYEGLPALARRSVPAPLLDLLSQYGNDLVGTLEQALVASSERLARVGQGIFSSVVGVIGGVVQTTVLLVLTGFFLYDFPALNRAFLHVVPERHQPGAVELVQKLDLSVGGYVRGQLLVSVVVGVAIGVGAAIIGLPFALGIGFIAGVFNIVPYLGPIVAFIPAALLALTLGLTQLLLTAAVFLAVNFLDGNVLSPFIFSYTIKLHPVTVLTSVIVGATLLGFVGALIAVPTAAFLTLLYRDYYLTSRWYKNGATPPGAGPEGASPDGR